MITYIFLGLVGVSTLVALQNWRRGVYLWLAIAILQDPIRKITPANPIYLTVAFFPVYAATFLGLLQSNARIRSFTSNFRSLTKSFQVLVVFLFASFVFAAVTQSPIRAAIGLMSYLGGAPAVLIGYFFLRNNFSKLDNLLSWFAALTSIMLIGVPLQYSGFKFSIPLLGTIGTSAFDRRWYSQFASVNMISGFYRSPEIMGWHAMVLTLICIYLILRHPQFGILFVSLAIWGTYAVFLCGRRKMLLMMIVFLVVLGLASGIRTRKKVLSYLIPVLLFAIPVLVWMVDDVYLLSFTSGLDVAGAKVAEKGLNGPLWLMSFVGPFGYGIGTLSQGAQHFGGGSNVNIPLVEGGFEKVMVELGLLGAICALQFGARLLITTIKVVKLSRIRLPGDIAPMFCFAITMANLSAFLIAFQFLGDPFIGTFFGLILGIFLSTVRLIQDTADPRLIDRERQLRDSHAQGMHRLDSAKAGARDYPNTPGERK